MCHDDDDDEDQHNGDSSSDEHVDVPCRRRHTKANNDDLSRSPTSSPTHDQHLTGVIIDIAACDGPVFFERVINKSYSSDEVIIQLYLHPKLIAFLYLLLNY